VLSPVLVGGGVSAMAYALHCQMILAVVAVGYGGTMCCALSRRSIVTATVFRCEVNVSWLQSA